MHKRYSIRMVGSFLLFLVAGTIGLVLLLRPAAQRLSRSDLDALAKADANFLRDKTEAYDEEIDEVNPSRSHAYLVRDSHQAQSEFLSGYLSRLLGVEVRLERLAAPDTKHETVTAAINPGEELTLVHERPLLGDVLLRPTTWVALAGFWAFSFALAWAVALPYFKAQRFAWLGSMATSLAHEIRNPIAAIRLHGQLLAQAQPASAGLIVHEAARIEDMVNQWMFLAQPVPPLKTEVVVAELLDKTARVLAPATEHAQVHLEITASPSRRLQADSHRLGQVFHNIILNAVQAMPDGGTLFIDVSESEIRFADTGPGFSPKALRRGAEKQYSEKEGGMGLGLCVARNIVQAHGGRLMIGNRPEGGALVRLKL